MATEATKTTIEVVAAVTLAVIMQLAATTQCHKLEWGPCLVHYLEPCSSDVIQFYLFSSDRPHELLPPLDPIMPDVPHWVNMSHPLKLIIHGYGGYADYNATRAIRSAYLKRSNVNVVVVDWGKLARLPCYPSAAVNTKQAGECTATFITGLMTHQHLHLNSENDVNPSRNDNDNGGGLTIANIHAIGYSLGAHVAAFTSNALEETRNEKLARITALDPALPFFATPVASWKLDKTDAHFVDVIHTNSGVFGKLENCGHLDFYLNGGMLQPFCYNDSNQPLCSHMASPVYFAESINSGLGFWGVRCQSFFEFLLGQCGQAADGQQSKGQLPDVDNVAPLDGDEQQQLRASPLAGRKMDWMLMGEHCNQSATGIFAVKTRLDSPFAMGLIVP